MYVENQYELVSVQQENHSLHRYVRFLNVLFTQITTLNYYHPELWSSSTIHNTLTKYIYNKLGYEELISAVTNKSLVWTEGYLVQESKRLL